MWKKPLNKLDFFGNITSSSKRALSVSNLNTPEPGKQKQFKQRKLFQESSSSDDENVANPITKAGGGSTSTSEYVHGRWKGEHVSVEEWWQNLQDAAKSVAGEIFNKYKGHPKISEPKLDHNSQLMLVRKTLVVRVSNGKAGATERKTGNCIEWKFAPANCMYCLFSLDASFSNANICHRLVRVKYSIHSNE